MRALVTGGGFEWRPIINASQRRPRRVGLDTFAADGRENLLFAADIESYLYAGARDAGRAR